MARQVERKLTGRTPAGQKDAFRYTTPRSDVEAKPVDAMENHTGNNNWGNALASINSSVSSFTNIAHEVNKKARAEGQTAGMIQGEDINYGGKSRAYWEGAEEVRGEKAAKVDLRAELGDYLANNKDKSPDEFLEGYRAIAQDKMNGRSDFYLRGFVPVSAEMEGQFLGKYKDHQREKAHTELKGDANQIISADLSQRIADIATHNDPEQFKAAMADDLAMYIKKYPNLPAREVMAMQINDVSKYAIEHGLPELMDFTNGEYDGVHLSSDPEFQDSIAKTVHSATEVRRLKKDRAATDYRASLKDNQERTTNQELAAAYERDESDLEGAATQHARLLANPQSYSTGEYNMLLKLTSSQIEGQGFRTKDNYAKTLPLLLKFNSGQLTGEAAYKALEENQDQFSPAGFKTAMNEVKDAETYLKSEGGHLELSDFNKRTSDITGAIGVTHKYSTAITAANKDAATDAAISFRTWRRQFQKDAGRYPNEEERDIKLKAVIQYHRENSKIRNSNWEDSAEGQAALEAEKNGDKPTEDKPKEEPKDEDISFIRDADGNFVQQ